MDEASAIALLGSKSGSETNTDNSLKAFMSTKLDNPPSIPPIGGGRPEDIDLAARKKVEKQQDFIKRNYVGVPIDLESEAGPQLKFMTAWQPTDEDRLTFLNSKLRKENPDFYGVDSPARKADTGEILIRVPDESGKPKEIPLNREGFSASDLATVAAHIPATLAAVAATLATKKLPLGVKLPKTMASLYSITAAAGTEAAQDVIARSISGADIQPGEILARRGVEIPAGLIMDAGAVGALKIGAKLLSPFASVKPNEIQKDLKEGMDYFKAEMGYDFPATIGEVTGSPLFLRTEASMARLPGSSAEATTKQIEKKGFFEGVQEEIIGSPRSALPSDESVGRTAISAIRSKLSAIQSSIKTKSESVMDAMTMRLNELMDKTTGVGQQVFRERVGAGVRARALSMYKAVQEEASNAYEQLYSLPGGSDRILKAPRAAKEAQSALDSLPGYSRKASPGGVSKTITEKFESVLPAKAISVMEELAGTKGAKMSLQDLIGARSALDDVIAKERGGLPDVKLRELVAARGLFTKAIKEAAESSPDPRMAPMWKAINDKYAQDMKKFDPAAIQKLFVKADKPGHILDEEIVSNLKASEYLQLKEFLGPSSPEFSTLKRSMVDEVMRSSRLPGGRIDSKAFIRDFNKFYQDKRAIFDDIFPKEASTKAQSIGEALSAMRDAESVDPKALASAMTDEPGLRKRLIDLGREQSKMIADYRSGLFKQIGEGTLDPNAFDSGKFVDLLYDKISAKEAGKVMSELAGHPDIVQQLRQKITERVFYDAQRAVKAVDPSRLGTAEVLRPANSTHLEDVLGNEDNRAKLSTILGVKTMTDLRMLGKLMRAGEISEQSFASAGGIAGGMFVTGMIREGPFGYVAEWAKQKFAGIFLTTPGLRQYAGNRLAQKLPLDEVAIGLIASQPFQQSLIREFGSQGARELTQNYLRSVGRYDEKKKPTESASDREKRFETLLGPKP